MNFELNYCGGIFYLLLFIIAYIYIDRMYYGNHRHGSQVDYPSIGPKMTDSEQPDSMIYLIEKFWTDSLENHPSYASGYSVVGYVTDENKAKQLVSEAGTYAGTGWPIPKEKAIPMMRYKAIKSLDVNHDR